MKKYLVILGIVAFIASCNDSGKSDDSKKDSSNTSTINTATVAKPHMAADSTIKPDSSHKDTTAAKK